MHSLHQISGRVCAACVGQERVRHTGELALCAPAHAHVHRSDRKLAPLHLAHTNSRKHVPSVRSTIGPVLAL